MCNVKLILSVLSTWGPLFDFSSDLFLDKKKSEDFEKNILKFCLKRKHFLTENRPKLLFGAKEGVQQSLEKPWLSVFLVLHSVQIFTSILYV